MVNIDTDKVSIENFYINIGSKVMNKDESLQDIGTLNSNINDKKLDTLQMYIILKSYLIGNEYRETAIDSIKDKINKLHYFYQKIILKDYLTKNEYSQNAINSIKDKINEMDDEFQLDIIFNISDYKYLQEVIKNKELLLIPKMATSYNEKNKKNNHKTRIYWTKNHDLKNKDIHIVPDNCGDYRHYASALKIGASYFFIDSLSRLPDDRLYSGSVLVLGFDLDKAMQKSPQGCSVFAVKIAQILWGLEIGDVGWEIGDKNSQLSTPNSHLR